MKVRHFMKHSILILITCFCMLFPFTMHPKAATGGSGAISNNRGTYWWQFVKEGVYDIGTGYGFIKSSMHVEFNLSANYSGQFTITINGTSNFSDVGILVKDGYISTSSSNQVKVQIVNTDHFSVDFYSSLSFTTVPSWTVSVSPGTLNVVPSAEETSLNNISAALTSNTYGLPAIYNELVSIDNALSVLDEAVSLLASINSISQIQSYPVYSWNVLGWASQFGDLNFTGLYPTVFYDSTANSSSWTASKRLGVPAKSKTSLVFLSDTNLTNNSWNLYIAGNFILPTVSRVTATQTAGYPLYIFEYIFDNSNNSNYTFVEIEFSQSFTMTPLYYGRSDLMPDEIHYFLGTEFNNTYTRLLQSIINAVGTISQTTINESITNINDYNQYQTTINQIENNYIDYFNTYNNYLDDNSIFDFSTIDTNGIVNFHSMFANFWNISLVRWPILIILLGLIVLVILG